MKNFLKIAMILAMVAFATSCGYKSEITPIPETDLSTFTAQTPDKKIVMGVMNSAGIRLIPPAYSAITLQSGCLIAQYEVAGQKLYNLFLQDGNKAIDENLLTCEWITDHFRATNSKGEFLYYPETEKTFGPHKFSVKMENFIFYQTEKGAGVANKSGIIMSEQTEIYLIKDQKSNAFFFAVPNGKKAVLYDASGKEVKKLSQWSWTQLQKKIKKDFLLNGLVISGEVPNIKAF